MVQNAERDFIIVTGGPGAGKSALIEELRRRGYANYERGRTRDHSTSDGNWRPRTAVERSFAVCKDDAELGDALL